MCFLKIFSHSVVYFLNHIFHRAEYLNFNEVQLAFFFFFHGMWFLCCTLKKKSHYQIQVYLDSLFSLACEGGVRFSPHTPSSTSISISLCFPSLRFMESSLPRGYSHNEMSGQETLSLLCNLPAAFLGLLWFLSWNLSSFHYSSLCGGYSGSRDLSAVLP